MSESNEVKDENKRKTNKNVRRIILQMFILIFLIVLTLGIKTYINREFSKSSFVSFKIIIKTDVEKKEIDNIVKEIFENKKYELEEINLFKREFRVKADSISEEEKSKIESKLEEKFKKDFTTQELKIYPERVVNQNIKMYTIYFFVILILASASVLIVNRLEQKNK